MREAGANFKEWSEVIYSSENYEQFIRDLRTPKQIEDCRLGINANTLKQHIDIWSEKPRVRYQETGIYSNFRGQITKLSYLNTIVHIKSMVRNCVDFDFYTDREPFEL